jgi:hypothetical protein
VPEWNGVGEKGRQRLERAIAVGRSRAYKFSRSSSKSAGGNPASGCFPLLLQMPVFFASCVAARPPSPPGPSVPALPDLPDCRGRRITELLARGGAGG